ncbi:MAG: hypothetical protein E6I48_01170 [Chloroflexi bacterium]|nr:MAG: hypothetical protein E6I48_01170 [Chloroflexota bacterium]
MLSELHLVNHARLARELALSVLAHECARQATRFEFFPYPGRVREARTEKVQVKALVSVVGIDGLDRIVNIVADRTVAIDQPSRDIPEQRRRKSELAESQALSRRKAGVQQEPIKLDVAELRTEVRAIGVFRDIGLRSADTANERLHLLSILASY